MKTKSFLLCFLMILALTACSSVAIMTSSKMNKLELGMSKKQVTSILGTGYTISEKRIENGNQKEILSYRDFYNNDEFYMFLFMNDKLEKWYREFLPQYEPIKK